MLTSIMRRNLEEKARRERELLSVLTPEQRQLALLNEKTQAPTTTTKSRLARAPVVPKPREL